MKIKELLDKFDKNKYQKWFELFHQDNIDNTNYFFQTHYLCEIIQYSFLQENNLLNSTYNVNLNNYLNEIKLETKSDINKFIFEFYDRKHPIRIFLFCSFIKEIKLDCEYLSTFSEFINKWFNKLLLNQAFYITKKDLNKILNTEI